MIRSRDLCFAFTCAILVGATGCTPSLKSIAAEVPKSATPSFVDASLDKFEDQQTRKRVADVLATAEMQRALSEVSAGLSAGLIQGLSRDDLDARVKALVAGVTEAATVSMAKRIESDIAPAAAAVARETVRAVMAETFSRENMNVAAKGAAQVSASATHAAVRAAADEIPTTVAPALEKAMVDSIGPALETVLRKNAGPAMYAMLNGQDVQGALATTSHVIAREAVFGTNEALAQLEARSPKKGLLAKAVGFFGDAGWVVWLVVGLLTALVLTFGLRLIKNRGERRRLQRETELHDTVLMTLATAMKASDGRPWAEEMQQLLRDHVAQRPAGANK